LGENITALSCRLLRRLRGARRGVAAVLRRELAAARERGAGAAATRIGACVAAMLS
jgi:hypothetical protein